MSPDHCSGNLCAHLEERDTLALIEDKVLIHKRRLGAHTLVARAQLVLQRVLHKKTNSVSNTGSVLALTLHKTGEVLE